MSKGVMGFRQKRTYTIVLGGPGLGGAAQRLDCVNNGDVGRASAHEVQGGGCAQDTGSNDTDGLG